MIDPGAGTAIEIEPGLAAPEAGPRVKAPFGRRLCAVSENRRVGRYDVIGVEDPAGPRPLAGQFYMLACERGWGEDRAGERPYLPRAFSVGRVRGQRLDFMLEVVGAGTARLGELQAGERVWLTGPLGIGFSAPAAVSGSDRAAALLVGGGIGIAPLVIWSETLGSGASRALLGFRGAEYAAAAELFDCPTDVATDDGSAGSRGSVTDLLEEQLERRGEHAVYACGPPPMLEAVRRICTARGVLAQLALESGMACGFGACFGCVVRTRDGYRRLCVDGPIVNAADLHEDWG